MTQNAELSHARPLAAILPAGTAAAAGARRLTAPTVSAAAATLSRLLGRGRHCALLQAHAVLRLTAADAGADHAGNWHNVLHLTSAGAGADPGADADQAPDYLTIADGARLLHGLTGIWPGADPFAPADPADANNPADASGPGPGTIAPWLAAALAGRLAATPLAGLALAAATPVPLASMASTTSTAAPVALESCCLLLTLGSDQHQFSCLARAPLRLWHQLLRHPLWGADRAPVQPWLASASNTAVVLARHTLPAGVLRTLAAGDVIVPDTPYFDTDGAGWLRLGAHTWRVRHTAPNALAIVAAPPHDTSTPPENTMQQQYDAADGDDDDDQIDSEMDSDTDLETDRETSMAHAAPESGAERFADYAAGNAGAGHADDDDQHDHHHHNPDPDPGPDRASHAAVASTSADNGDPLDTMPLDLTFELGRLSLPLGELRTLGAGAVLLLAGGSPAAVAIVAAGKTMGRGEIVDVAGQLGVRLTHWGTPC